MTAVVVYGIANCDTVKKARQWLDARRVGYRFHDLRRDGAPEALIARWFGSVPADALLNRKSTTWRALAETERAGAATADGALRLMCLHPTLIRRPVVEWPDGLTVGFDAEAFGARSVR